ncbi:unnamed protein product [Phaedon cochleariae]|uniref:Uncharacterized protein n=1 Tax=Phaedon cochleariae TaxID=80249 RepID=A0A9N9X156_PHACE|nr:unnamed protein product [Phaedon cochleariae]
MELDYKNNHIERFNKNKQYFDVQVSEAEDILNNEISIQRSQLAELSLEIRNLRLENSQLETKNEDVEDSKCQLEIRNKDMVEVNGRMITTITALEHENNMHILDTKHVSLQLEKFIKRQADKKDVCVQTDELVNKDEELQKLVRNERAYDVSTKECRRLSKKMKNNSCPRDKKIRKRRFPLVSNNSGNCSKNRYVAISNINKEIDEFRIEVVEDNENYIEPELILNSERVL